MLRTLATRIGMIDSKVIDTEKAKKNRLAMKIKLAGVKFLGQPGMAQIRYNSGEVVTIHDVKLVVRRSGRNNHISRYIVGKDHRGVTHEVFIEQVTGVQSIVNKIAVAIQKAAIKVLRIGLNSKSIYA